LITECFFFLLVAAFSHSEPLYTFFGSIGLAEKNCCDGMSLSKSRSSEHHPQKFHQTFPTR
jgi:hypothetical protein